MRYLLGIDIGTSGTKTLLCDEKGKVRGSASAEYPCYTPKPGWSEQDPKDWWNATVKTVRAVLHQTKIRGNRVAAIGLSGQMHGSVFVDARANVIRRALLWNDQRTAAQCKTIEKTAGGRAALIKLVANPALTGYTAPKILWLRNHEPKKFERVRYVLLPKDYVRYRLTGEFATEVSDASGTLLFDVKNRRWSNRLIDALKLDRSMFPPCTESHEVSGELTSSVASLLGLAAGTPVVGGAGDQPAGAVGNGIVGKGIVSATMGTSGVVFAHAEQFVPNRQGNLQSFCHAVQGKWCVFGCMLSAGGSFQWLRNTLFADMVKKAGDPGALYPAMIDEASAAPPTCEGLYFLPYLTGERCPYADPDARGAWIGLTVRHGRPALIRAVLEGITFGMRDQIELMRRSGLKINQVRAGGGGARSPWWRQLQADMYQVPVVTINTQEGAAYGVALLAGVGAGIWRNVPSACRQAIRTMATCRPRRKFVSLYNRSYPQFSHLYQSLRKDFQNIGRLSTHD